MELSAFRKRFQPLFEAFLFRKTASSAAWTADPVLERIIRYPEQLAGGEGKRIRPFMAWWAYRAAGGEDRDDVLRLCVALELFHVFALVHDDIMDHGTTRHGVPTVHLATESLLTQERRLGDLKWAGESQAMLLGDLLFQWSQEAFYATPGIDPVVRERAAIYFRQMIEEVIVGQMIDMDLTTRTSTHTDLINRKMHLKTASYTFIRPLHIGAALADAPEDTFDWCERMGESIGRAFQIQDDLLDLTIHSEGTGKTAFSDLQARQHTLFTQYIFEHGSPAAQQELQSLFGVPLNEADRVNVQALFDASGALAYGRREIEEAFTRAMELLETAPFPNEACDDLRIFITGLKQRSV